MTDVPSSQVETQPRIPLEVCERVIEAVYDDRYTRVPTALSTLFGCALVCRAWRSPAQKTLFAYVMLRDKDALCHFGQSLDTSPELGLYVHQLELRGYLRVPFSPAVLFPAILRGRLPNLSTLNIHEFENTEKNATPLPDGVKELPTLPVHRYLPCLVKASISHLRVLSLFSLTFPSFGDFARILYTLPNLRQLYCQWVRWAVLGRDPPCMVKGRSNDSQIESAFLPHLEVLQCTGMGAKRMQKLLGAPSGPSLRRLQLDLFSIHIDSTVEDEYPPSNLPVIFQSFPHLDHLQIFLEPEPEPEPHEHMLVALRHTLVSWAASDSDQCELGDRSTTCQRRHRKLFLEPYRRDIHERERFTHLLRVIGPAVEAALCRQTASAGDPQAPHNTDGEPKPQDDPCRADVVVEELGDRLEWVDWWQTRIRECFPTFARWKRLEVYPCHHVDAMTQWLDHERTPEDVLPNTAPTASLPSMTQESATDL